MSIAELPAKTQRKARASSEKFMPMSKASLLELEYLDMMFNRRMEDPRA